MKYIHLTTLIVLFACNSDRNSSKKGEIDDRNDQCFAYPAEIKSLGNQSLYDSAIWYVYMWQCDQVYIPKSDTLTHKYFGELELRFGHLFLKHDTLELNFNFIDRGNPIVPSMMQNYRELVTGVGFDLKAKRRIFMISPNGFSISEHGGSNRYENPKQPQVLQYVKSHEEKLNGCFRQLLRSYGILK